MTGKISKLVASFGSTWGRIEPDGEARSVFFNSLSLDDSSEFEDLVLAQNVDFDEEVDLANGTRAVRVKVRTAEAVGN